MDREMKARVIEEYSSRIAKITGCCGSGLGPETATGKESLDCCETDSCCSGAEGEMTRLTQILGLQSFGCGNPVGLSSIAEGDIVVDLGSGAGFDAIMAAERVGISGKVVGVDLSATMIEKASENARKMNLEDRITFVNGDIEDIPLPDESASLVISNCVLALATDKQKVFNEIYRILKPGGRFVVSDIVSEEDIPEEMRNDAELFTRCVSGAAQVDRYLSMIRNAGFHQIEEIERHGKSHVSFGDHSVNPFSITVRGYR